MIVIHSLSCKESSPENVGTYISKISKNGLTAFSQGTAVLMACMHKGQVTRLFKRMGNNTFDENSAGVEETVCVHK